MFITNLGISGPILYNQTPWSRRLEPLEFLPLKALKESTV
jgi:hypothetical protein